MKKFGNVLVTGGAGFLGSQLVIKILNDCERIWVLDDLSTGKRSAVPSSSNVTFVEGSILDAELLKTILPKINYIFHFACANLVNSVTDIEKDFNTNLLGGFTLLSNAKEHSPHLKRFVYASTASIYGEADAFPTVESYHNIKLPYAASKFSMEHYVRTFFFLYGLPVTILRFSNVYGPGQLSSNPYCGVVAKFFEAVNGNKSLEVFGDGLQTRDFTFVEDALEAVVLSANTNKALGKEFNIGTGSETQIIKLAETVKNITGYQGKINHSPKRVVDVVSRRCLNISKINQELGWAPRYSIKEGLIKTYIWLQGSDI